MKEVKEAIESEYGGLYLLVQRMLLIQTTSGMAHAGVELIESGVRLLKRAYELGHEIK